MNQEYEVKYTEGRLIFNRLFPHFHESIFELYNGLGEIIWVFNIKEENRQFEIGNLPQGIYYIRNRRTQKVHRLAAE